MQHAYLVWFEAGQQVSHAVNAAIPRLPDLSQVPHGTLHDLREGRGEGRGGEGRGVDMSYWSCMLQRITSSSLPDHSMGSFVFAAESEKNRRYV